MTFRVVIPARYGSSRLPGKPLLPIGGKPMIQWVYENALAAGGRETIVATDDARIERAVTEFGGVAALTSTEHTCGTERLAELVQVRQWDPRSIIVNLQGDEPGVPPGLVQRVAQALADCETAGISTLATPIRTVEELFDPNVVKVVLNERSMATYFSRAAIPWVRDAFGPPMRSDAALPSGFTFLRHLGLYAYRAETLQRLAAAASVPSERAESLEQLRALHLGIGIHVSVIDDAPGHGVDTRADLERVERQLVSA